LIYAKSFTNIRSFLFFLFCGIAFINRLSPLAVFEIPLDCLENNKNSLSSTKVAIPAFSTYHSILGQSKFIYFVLFCVIQIFALPCNF
jgi:hypothetical protein